MRLKIIFYKIVIVIFLIPSFARADFLDQVADLVDEIAKPVSAEKPALQPAKATDYKLPENWRAYWLVEPEYSNKIFIADVGQTNAPIVMLIHGLGQNGLRDWLSIVPELSKHNRIILIDLPGFANSPSPQTKLSPTYYARVLHFVKNYFSLKPITIVGHSMGGAVSLRYAASYPDDVSQLALIDVAGILQRTAFVKHSATDRLSTISDSTSPLINYVAGIKNLGNKIIEKSLLLPDPTTWLGKSKLAWGMTLQDYPNINAALSLVEEDFSAAIFQQSKPVSILWGTEDLIAPVRTAYLLSANLKNSDLTFIKGAGHVPMASHSSQVSQWLIKSISQPKQHLIKNSEEIKPVENYYCDNSNGETITGVYDKVFLSNCKAVFLDKVTTKELIVKNSVVEILNSKITNPSTSITANSSVIIMTASSVAGVIDLNGSRIDFAGVQLQKEKPFIIKQSSRLVLSVNQANEKLFLHKDVTVENGIL